MINSENAVLEARDVTIRYGGQAAVKNVNLSIYEKKITAIIGPSGCGKSTLLRSLNRMNDFIDHVTQDGEILYRDTNLYGRCRSG